MHRLLLLFVISLILKAEIIDRIAIIVGQQVITESQINEEIRVTAFLNRQSIKEGEEDRRSAADRLVQQFLVKREMDLGNYPGPTADEVQKYYDQLIQVFGSLDSFRRALTTYRITSETLKQHLALQLTTLRFIEYRFRPDFNISEEDIAAYRRSHSTLPGAELSHDAIREVLIEERTDYILAAWLEESRKQIDIVFLDKVLQ
jgi:hypothetical protein